MVEAIKTALKDLDALVTIVAKDTGALVMSDPDEESVSSTLEGDLEMTFGHVRRAHAAVSAVEAALSTDAEPEGYGVFTKNKGQAEYRFSNLVSDTEEDAKELGREYFTDSYIVKPLYAAPPAASVAVKALEFYADPKNWVDTPSWDGDPECITPKAIPVTDDGDGARPCDCGDTARAALSALSAQVQDVAETEADIVERMVKSIRDPFPSANLSVSRGIDGWRELMRDALRAAAPAAKQATP